MKVGETKPLQVDISSADAQVRRYRVTDSEEAQRLVLWVTSACRYKGVGTRLWTQPGDSSGSLGMTFQLNEIISEGFS